RVGRASTAPATAERNPHRPEHKVPSRKAPTIQAAIDSVYDRTRDGRLVIDVGPGIFPESVEINRPVVLRGQGPAQTVIQGNGLVAAVSVTATGASVQELSAVGGSTGIATTAATTEITNARMLRNVGAGVSIAGGGAQLRHVVAEANGGDGLVMSGAVGARGIALSLSDNSGSGAVLSDIQSTELVDSQIANNATGGIRLVSATSCNLSNNQSVNNV